MDLQSLSILVIDDDDGDRKLLKRLLSKNGHEGRFEEATAMSEALERDDEKFDAVFLDYYLPGTIGLNHLPELRAQWPRAAIVLMTGQGSETVAKSAILSGATDYISKGDITSESLETTLSISLKAAHERWRVEQQRLDLATFSEVLVHDFKAPIRAAAYLAEQIEEDIQSGDAEEVQEGLRLLKKSADQMSAMILSLSDHIRLDREVEAQILPPVSLIDAALLSLSLVIRDANARVSVAIEDDVPDLVCSGPQISQLLQNLIANAIKFSGDAEPQVAVSVRNEGMMLLFEVADKGVGIAAEHLDHVFEPFKRAPSSQSVAGTGLGLSTCRKIVLRHDGQIWCKSTLGVGTSMFFSLPLQTMPPMDETPELLVGSRAN